MRTSRVRLGALVALGLTLGTPLPPASAEGTKEIVFMGTATLNAGLDFPCATDTTTRMGTTKGTKNCPSVPVPTGDTSKKGKPFNIDGNNRTGNYTSNPGLGGCTAEGENVDKPTKPVGVWKTVTCSLGGTFTLTGYCGLSQGRGTGTLRIFHATGTQNLSYNFTWFDLGGGILTVRGNYWPGFGPKPATPEGDIDGTVKATPTVVGTPNTNSCLDKTARFFDLDGTLTLVHPKVMP